MGGRNRVIVFINWVASYVNNNGGSRLIIRKFKPEELVDKTSQVSKPD
jgi:NADH dehydrogenase